jgi:cytochrome c biogenesis protein CcmG/thiol:disulfide interchange protein DsbE
MNRTESVTMQSMKIAFHAALRTATGIAAGFILTTTPMAMAAEMPAAKPWQVVTLDGTRIGSETLKDKVVLIHFWASWCAPCREEMPALQTFYQAHHKDGLEIIAVSLDDETDQPKVRDFVRSFSFPVAMMSHSDMNGFGRVWVLPLSILIDRQGRIRKDDWTGDQKIDAARLDATVLPLLSESAQVPETH